VSVTLTREDSQQELPHCLEGTQVVRVGQGNFATFTKLKIQSTSQQQGTSFRLLFTLKRFNGNNFIDVPEVSALSTPIEVFSHTYYLKKAPKPSVTGKSIETVPSIMEVLPSQGSRAGNERVVILGNNFVNSPHLVVMFGAVLVQPTFHESRTLIVATPCHPEGGHTVVRVSNDGQNFSDTHALFSFW